MFPITERQAYELAAEGVYKDLVECENHTDVVTLVAACQHHILDDLSQNRVTAPRVMLTLMHVLLASYILASTESRAGQWHSVKRLTIKHFDAQARDLIQGFNQLPPKEDSLYRMSRAALN